MATAATIKKNIAKLEAALKSKATPKSLKSKLETQLVKSKAELSGLKKGTKPKTSSAKSAQSALKSLKELVNKNKKYKNYKGAGVDLERDADRPAKPIGRRTAKASGKTYYEYRANRIDVKQPPKRYPKLEKGGYMAKGGMSQDVNIKVGDWFYDTKNQLNIEVTTLYPNNKVVLKSIDYNKNGEKREFDMPLHILKSKVKGGSYFKIPKSNLKKEQGGYMAKGGVTFQVGESVIYPSTKNNKLDKSTKGTHNKYAEKELLIDKIYIDEPYNTASVSVKSNGEKVPFNLVLNPRYLKKYDNSGMMGHGSKINGNSEIVDFYVNEYPKDDIAVDINPKATFNGLYEVLSNKGDAYKYIGVADSIVRERVFEKLAEIKGVKYDVIYDMWMDSDYEKGGYMAKGGSLSSIKEEYDENEDNNAHSENVVLLAKHFGTKEDLVEAKRILALHEKEGHLTSENGKKRQVLHLKLIEKARTAMDKEGIEFAKGGYMAKGGYYAKGGAMEHGLKRGDTIIDDMSWDNSVKVLNNKTGYAVVHLETGERKEMKAMGGEMHRTQE